MKRFLRLAPILILIAIAGGGLALLILYGAHRWYGNPLKQGLPPAQVHIGTPLKWRVLAERSILYLGGFEGYSLGGCGTGGGLLAANFDDDKDDEILLVGREGESELFELDGSFEILTWGELYFGIHLIAWDYDRDGTAEVVPCGYLFQTLTAVTTTLKAPTNPQRNTTVPKDVPIYYIDGQIADHLPSESFLYDQITADVNGDGFDELILRTDKQLSEYTAYGCDGEAIWTFNLDLTQTRSPTAILVSGDINGDWRDEILNTIPTNPTIYRLNQDTEVVADWPSMMTPFVVCIDLTTDGTDEIVSSGGYMHYDTGDTVKFKYPGVSVHTGEFVIGEITGTGMYEIVVEDRLQGGIYIFNLSGNCVYYEELGDAIINMTIAHAGGRDHLVVQTSERILVYP